MVIYLEDGFEGEDVDTQPDNWVVIAGTCLVKDAPVYVGTRSVMVGTETLSRMSHTEGSEHSAGKHTLRLACYISDAISSSDEQIIQLHSSDPAILHQLEFTKSGSDLILRIYEPHNEPSQEEFNLGENFNTYFVLTLIYDLDEDLDVDGFITLYINHSKLGEFQGGDPTTKDCKAIMLRTSGNSAVGYFDYVKWESGEYPPAFASVIITAMANEGLVGLRAKKGVN